MLCYYILKKNNNNNNQFFSCKNIICRHLLVRMEGPNGRVSDGPPFVEYDNPLER